MPLSVGTFWVWDLQEVVTEKRNRINPNREKKGSLAVVKTVFLVLVWIVFGIIDPVPSLRIDLSFG